MPQMIRFPRPAVSPFGPSEADQNIEIFSGGTIFIHSTPGNTNPWKTNLSPLGDCPYEAVAIEFVAPAAVADLILGNGTTQRIALYGDRVGNGSSPMLLGILGVNLGNAAPQIPLIWNGATGIIAGYSEVVCNVGVYASLGIGCIGGPLVIGQDITVTAKPIRRRDYAG